MCLDNIPGFAMCFPTGPLRWMKVFGWPLTHPRNCSFRASRQEIWIVKSVTPDFDEAKKSRKEFPWGKPFYRYYRCHNVIARVSFYADFSPQKTSHLNLCPLCKQRRISHQNAWTARHIARWFSRPVKMMIRDSVFSTHGAALSNRKRLHKTWEIRISTQLRHVGIRSMLWASPDIQEYWISVVSS